MVGETISASDIKPCLHCGDRARRSTAYPAALLPIEDAYDLNRIAHHLSAHRPKIAETALLYSGAFVWGDVTVGPHAVVMPNSVVYEDVPSRGVMLGNPARLVDLACNCGEPLQLARCVNVVTDAVTGAKRFCPLNPRATVACPRCEQDYNVGELCVEVGI